MKVLWCWALMAVSLFLTAAEKTPLTYDSYRYLTGNESLKASDPDGSGLRSADNVAVFTDADEKRNGIGFMDAAEEHSFTVLFDFGRHVEFSDLELSYEIDPEKGWNIPQYLSVWCSEDGRNFSNATTLFPFTQKYGEYTAKSEKISLRLRGAGRYVKVKMPRRSPQNSIAVRQISFYNQDDLAETVKSLPNKPLLSGAFWQIHAFMYPTDEALVKELERCREIGLNKIIVHYVAGWNGATYESMTPSKVLTQEKSWQGRDPINVLFTAADKMPEMEIYIGDFAAPHLAGARPEVELDIWLGKPAMNFRQEFFDRYKHHSSWRGYYFVNEPNPYRFDYDSRIWVDGVTKLADWVKTQKPDLNVIQSIGLYFANGNPNYMMTPEKLELFWHDWFKIKSIDTFMIIDGIGTGLGDLHYSGLAQKWCAEKCREFNKNYWCDIECAFMAYDITNAPFNPWQLIDSLLLAAKYTDTMVTFDYINYMNPELQRGGSAELFNGYVKWRNFVNQQDAKNE